MSQLSTTEQLRQAKEKIQRQQDQLEALNKKVTTLDRESQRNAARWVILYRHMQKNGLEPPSMKVKVEEEHTLLVMEERNQMLFEKIASQMVEIKELKKECKKARRRERRAMRSGRVGPPAQP